MRFLKRMTGISLLLGMALPASATGLMELDPTTLDGGGGQSSGGDFTLRATVGQPDAGTLTGGQITVKAGFWPSTGAQRSDLIFKDSFE